MTPEQIKRCRPNKTAIGFMLNNERHKKTGNKKPTPKDFYNDEHYCDLLALMVHGTTDKLGRGRHYYMTRVMSEPCQCCDSKIGKWRLNDKGRAKLAGMKRRKGTK